MISLKLIVEDEDIVQKINENLSPQIRVWGYERTNNSFSAYQLCDSRIYEYLIPTYSFLPPHPSSYLGRKIAESAKESNDEEAWKSRQEEVAQFWEKVDEVHIKPILEGYDDQIRKTIEAALHLREDKAAVVHQKTAEQQSKDMRIEQTRNEDSAQVPPDNGTCENIRKEVQDFLDRINKANAGKDQIKQLLETYGDRTKAFLETVLHLREQDPSKSVASLASDAGELSKNKQKKASPIAEGIRKLRAAYVEAKRSYRIPSARLKRIRDCLAMYEGTRNYHNFTIDKGFKDPSAKRVIKSFVVDPNPILINGTEWLSLKVHGQSFMMHQIRKMIGMVALVVRCGCDPERIFEAYGENAISIPKAPSLGLLLERPVFDSYNRRAKSEFGKEPLDFGKYEKEMQEFKQREIYERIYRDEEQNNV